MTGAGRTGRFLAWEYWDLRPDIVAVSKGFGAGYAPLGAVAAHRRIVTAVMNHGGFAHGYTYAGNPLACTAGLAVLKELEEHRLIENAERQGRNLRARLSALMNRYPFIGDVRGKGLLLAFELVRDQETMEPLPPEMNAHLALVEEAYDRGLIIYSRRTRGGIVGDHFMVCPPLIVTDAQIEELMEILVASLDAFASANELPVTRG
jgi:adenosylmethionine-8-amino-7-oxononanoate aminotransferase